MSHIAHQLIDFAKKMALLSESNLAVVEQTNAGMSEVNLTVEKTSATLSQLSDGQLDRVALEVEDMITKGIRLFGSNRSDLSCHSECADC